MLLKMEVSTESILLQDNLVKRIYKMSVCVSLCVCEQRSSLDLFKLLSLPIPEEESSPSFSVSQS